MSWIKTVNIKGPAASSTNDVTGITALVQGQGFVDVVFPQKQASYNWHIVDVMIFNTIDALPLNITVATIVSRSLTGFRLRLSAPPDTPHYYALWTIRPPDTSQGQATTYLFSGPSTVGINRQATFLVQLKSSQGTPAGAPLTITPNDGGAGGVFNPATIQLTNDVTYAEFDYTPKTYGTKTIQCTNNLGLANPNHLLLQVVASTYLIVGPASVYVGNTTSAFTVELPAGASVINPVTVTPNDGGLGGTFTPSSVVLTTGVPSKTFTYTPITGGATSIATTNDGGLTDPTGVPFNAIPWTPDLLAGLMSWYKADALAALRLADGATVLPWPDSSGNNHHLDWGSSPPTFKANAINNLPAVHFNGAQALGPTNPQAAFGGCTVYVVAKSTGDCCPVSASDAGHQFCRIFGDPGNQVFADHVMYAISLPLVTPRSQWSFLCCGRVNYVGTVYFSERGGGAIEGTYYNASASQWYCHWDRMGYQGGSNTSWFNGDIAEVITYDHWLSDADRTLVDNYIIKKYAIPHAPPPVASLRLKADSLALADGAPVAAWNDSSGNGCNAVQAVVANQPTFKTNIQNGKPAVLFNGANLLAITPALAAPLQSSNWTVFAVVKPIGTITDGSIFSEDYNLDGAPTNPYVRCKLGYSVQNASPARMGAGYFDGSTWRCYSAPDNDTANTVYLYTAVNRGDNVYLYRNGVFVGYMPTGTANPGSGRNYHVGAGHYDAQPQYWNGYIFEFVKYNFPLSDLDRQNEETSLKAKYGL